MNNDIQKLLSVLDMPENVKWPFIDIVEYTKFSLWKIEQLPIYLNVDDKITVSNKLRDEIFDFIKTSYKIQEWYSDMLNIDKIKHKWNEKDVVTEADVMIEACFREKISEYIPNYTIAWEEDEIDVHDKTKIILIDPIDWTSWFIKWVARYWTVLWAYRNWYNIMSVVLNTKKWIIYFSDLNWFNTYEIWEKNWEIIINKNKIDKIDETEKDNIYLHLNFKWEDKVKNEEIKNKLENWFEQFNKENNTGYKIVFMQTASDTWVKVWRKEVWGFVHYWPAPHDIAWNLIYSIHNPDLNFTNHLWEKYNYFDHDDLIKSYVKYNENKDTDWKSYLYKYPMVMTNDKKLHNFILDILEDYKDIFNKKAQITN